MRALVTHGSQAAEWSLLESGTGRGWAMGNQGSRETRLRATSPTTN